MSKFFLFLCLSLSAPNNVHTDESNNHPFAIDTVIDTIQDTENLNQSNPFDAFFEKKEIKESINHGHKYEIEVCYPQLITNNTTKTYESDIYFNEIISKSIDLPVKNFIETEKSISAEAEVDYTGRLVSSYRVFFISDDYISIGIDMYTYTGGAHGSYWIETINYDRKAQKILTLKDICVSEPNYLEVIANCARPLLQDLFKEKAIGTDVVTDEWALSGTSPTADNYTAWALTPQGLFINFGIYQVTAYCNGDQEILIPYDKLQDVLNSSITK